MRVAHYSEKQSLAAAALVLGIRLQQTHLICIITLVARQSCAAWPLGQPSGDGRLLSYSRFWLCSSRRATAGCWATAGFGFVPAVLLGKGRGRRADRPDPWQGEHDPWGRNQDDHDDDEGDDGDEDQPDATSRLYRSIEGIYQHVKFIRVVGEKMAKVQFVDTGRVVTVQRSKLGEFDEDVVGCSHFVGEGEAGSDSGGTAATSKTATSRLTTTSAAEAALGSAKGQGKVSGKYRGGTAPLAPINNGSVVFRTYRNDVRVWNKLAAPYMPISEMALRL